MHSKQFLFISLKAVIGGIDGNIDAILAINVGYFLYLLL